MKKRNQQKTKSDCLLIFKNVVLQGVSKSINSRHCRRSDKNDSEYGSSHPEVFCKKVVLKNFTKFTGKHLRRSFFLNKVAGLRQQNKKSTVSDIQSCGKFLK